MMSATSASALGLKRAIRAQLASEAASKDDWTSSGPSIVVGEMNTQQEE